MTLWLLIVGCDDSARSPATVPVAKPAASTATSQPASQPVRPPGLLMIDQQQVEFPAAVLRLRPEDGQLHPILCSDDPREALNRDYQGNSFYIELPGQFSDAGDLTDKPFVFVNASTDREDVPTGIFLQGNRYHLQAQDVKIELKGDTAAMEAWISGTFLQFDLQNDGAPGRLVAVAGRLKTLVR